MTVLAGFDVGGTRCAVVLARSAGQQVQLLDRRRFATPPTPEATLQSLGDALEELQDDQEATAAAIGISCGGPLDSRRGLILGPPNLPGWERVDVFSPFRRRFHVAVALHNDANACALAEWRWGAGSGYHNLIFLTFGTGMGAGLILDGRLYSGTNDLAGEVGHVRLAEEGPEGYGKQGSFEGFCSGGGIARQAQALARRHFATGAGPPPTFAPTPEDVPYITAEKVGRAAQDGDAQALHIFETVARQLGRGLALLVDVLNPQRIVIGSIYGRQQSLLEPRVLETLRQEALPRALAVCEIVPAALGERVGLYAGLSVALEALGDGTDRPPSTTD